MQQANLKQTFQDAVAYRISLPNSYEFRQLLSPSCLEDVYSDYRMFTEEIRKRIESFIAQQGEQTKIGVDTIIDMPGPIHCGLEFKCQPEITIKLKEAFEDLFSDLEIAEEWRSKGASWRHLPIDKFDDIKWGLV